MHAWNRTEDVESLLRRFENEEVSEANGNTVEATEAIAKVCGIMGDLQSSFLHELEMNQVASKEDLGWAVVKQIETDPVFKVDEDGSKTKNLKDAVSKAYRAALQKKTFHKNSWGGRGGGGGRGGRGIWRGRGGFVARHRPIQQQYYMSGYGDRTPALTYEPQGLQSAAQPRGGGVQANAPICWK